MMSDTQQPPMNWICQQIIATRQVDNGTVRFNPKPPGVFFPGSTTDIVYQWMLKQVGTVTCSEVIEGTGCTRKAVDWALRFLTHGRLIVAHPDISRNPRYLRYRAARKG